MEFTCDYKIGIVGVKWIYHPEATNQKFICLHTHMKNEDVVKIVFRKKNLGKFPRGIEEIFPRTESLEIYKCGLTLVERNDLIGFKNLVSLRLNCNNIESLPSDLFVGMKKLNWITFSGNKLKFLSSKLLQPIMENGLKHVDFRCNRNFPYFYSPRKEGSVESIQQLMEAIDKNFEVPIEDEWPNFSGVFEGLWKSKKYSDFTIIGGEEEAKEFRVHKNILEYQSSVLAAIFETDMKESRTGAMTIDDFSAGTVEGMLQFMYTGQLKDEADAMNLYEIAEKYDVMKLKTRTEEIILSNIDASNAIEVFGFAHLHKAEKLKFAAFEVIKKMFPETPLKDSLMDRPEDLKQMVKIKKKFLAKLKFFNKD